jgi:hypothetical protein
MASRAEHARRPGRSSKWIQQLRQRQALKRLSQPKAKAPRDTSRRCSGSGWVNLTTGEAVARSASCRACGKRVGLRWVREGGQCARGLVQPHNRGEAK